MDFVLASIKDAVSQSGLYVAVRAIRDGIRQNSFNFFAMLELYNHFTCTFFTPSGELGFALHEMHEVSDLKMGDRPYEEYVPGTEELHILKKHDPGVYETYWELLCHYHIYVQLTGARAGGVKHLSWANYLFPGVDNKQVLVSRLKVCTEEELADRIADSVDFYTADSDEDIFAAETIFESFHRQARTLISGKALLAGFLMLWLKKCVVPTLPHEAITVDVVYPAVMLAYG